MLIGFFLLAACKSDSANQPIAPPREPAAAASATPARSLAKIVAFGDSLTAGAGLTAAESYPSLLQKRLDADGYKYEVVNAGVSGDTSAGGLRRIDWALEGDVRFVIVELGANDILRGQPIPAMKENLSEIIKRAKARKAEVLLAGMQAPTSSGPEYRKAAEEAFLDLAEEHRVALIPFFLENVAGIETLNQRDGIHPNTEGTRMVAETVYRYLKPMLDKDKQ